MSFGFELTLGIDRPYILAKPNQIKPSSFCLPNWTEILCIKYAIVSSDGVKIIHAEPNWNFIFGRFLAYFQYEQVRPPVTIFSYLWFRSFGSQVKSKLW
jgi:hypothetical protein